MNELWIPLWRGVTSDGDVVYGSLTVQEHTDTYQILEAHKGMAAANNHNVIPESLAMQTGLKDANGVDIYGSMPGTRGGDVVKSNNIVFIVEYDIRMGRWDINDNHGWQLALGDFILTIIGNAYLNPELLGVCDA